MPLFHPRVIEKHLKHIEPITAQHAEILKIWAENLSQGIYDSETQNDDVFIQRILVDILGYVRTSDGQNWTVSKNIPVGKGNVDAALGNFSSEKTEILAPFELKGAKTKDLDVVMAGRNKTPVQQAWEYAMDAKGAQWVCVSNYREIRLYAIGYGRKDYESFDLSKLNEPKEYARFILLLSADRLLNGKTQALLKESEQVDKDITNQLYADYKSLRAKLIQTIGDDNPDKEPLEIIRYTQTILDRILFIAFAEDKGLLPDETLKKAYETQNDFNPQPVWENFKGLFKAINKGNSKLNIPAYNGGLFADDPALDNLSISDELCEGFKLLGEYDFDSDVSVNILGHIFEQSISDLEELKAHAENVEEINKKQSKRKKDGIFYTPAYITRYIVEQAVGGWLSDRKKELGFDDLPILEDADYDSIKMIERGKRKGQIVFNKKVEKHIKAWEAYKDTLSNIKVLDPACGSGAFLNEVFDYLKTEGEAVNGELANLKGEQIALFRWDTHILANNIYGVDLNSESVEITKLSLWLKTANKQEKLTYLEDNIKVGNSLIDDPEIAGHLAFDWKVEFSEIMQAGGFDVIVGNPPYVFAREKIDAKEKDYFADKYISAQYQVNTYLLFIEKSLFLIKPESGRSSLIVPNAWLMVSSAERLREFLLKHSTINSITNLTGFSFENVNVETIILALQRSACPFDHKIEILQNNEEKTFSIFNHKKQKSFDENLGKEFQIFVSDTDTNLLEKITRDTQALDDIYEVKAGLQAYEKNKGIPKQSAEDVKNRIYDFDEKINDQTYKYLDGKDVGRYYKKWNGLYLQYGDNLAAPREFRLFSSPVIIIREITGKYPRCMISTFSDGREEVFLFNRSNIAVLNRDPNFDLRYLLGILNSTLMSYYFMKVTPKSVRQMFPKIILKDLRQFPIKNVKEDMQAGIVGAVDNISISQNEFIKNSDSFVRLLTSEFNIEKLSRKLENWFEYSFAEFVRGVEQSIKPYKLSLSQKSEWMEYFEKEKAKALELKNKIDQTDREIDQMVYELYELTPEEISLIEGSV